MSASAVFDGPGTIRLSDRDDRSPAVGEFDARSHQN